MNVLYVEDNKVNAIVMDKMLSKNNSHVTIAENGSEALKIVKEEKINPDLILVDINLGHNQMDGCELLLQLRKFEELKKTPMFAVTAYAMPGDKQRFIRAGFDNYFSKPVNFKKLLKVISKLKPSF